MPRSEDVETRYCSPAAGLGVRLANSSPETAARGTPVVPNEDTLNRGGL
jgi:hypothetical protein